MTTSLARGPMGGDSYTQIHRGVFRDPRISLKAKGLFGLLSTHNDDWKITLKQLAKEFPEGVSALASAVDELEKHFYLIPSRERDANGRLGDAVWFYTDLPAQFLALGVTDDDTIRTRVEEEFEKWQSGRSQPKSENPDLDDPSLDEPSLDDQPYKKRKKKESKTEEDQQDLFGGNAADAKPDNSSPLTEGKTKRDLNAGREDVKRLCDKLAVAVSETLGEEKPQKYDKKWLDAARLMLDRDGYTEAQVADLITFAHEDSGFWGPHILDMKKLRDKAKQLKAQRLAQLRAANDSKRTRGGFTPYREDPNNTTDLTEYLNRRNKERQEKDAQGF